MCFQALPLYCKVHAFPFSKNLLCTINRHTLELFQQLPVSYVFDSITLLNVCLLKGYSPKTVATGTLCHLAPFVLYVANSSCFQQQPVSFAFDSITLLNVCLLKGYSPKTAPTGTLRHLAPFVLCVTNSS